MSTLRHSLLAVLYLSLSIYAESPRHFLWKVSDHDSEIWLLGSLHLATPKLYPLAPVIETAFAASEALAVELDIEHDSTMREVAQEMLLGGMYGFQDSLGAHIPAPLLNRLDHFARSWNIPTAPLRRLRPWLITIQIGQLALQKAGLDPSYGVDRYFLQKARQRKMPIQALETVSMQASLFRNLPDSLQGTLLEWTLNEADSLTTTLDTLLLAWSRGDTLAMEQFALGGPLATPRFQAFYHNLYTKRNQRMAIRAESYLRQNRKYFVVVGSAHLVGPEGVPNLLRKRGFRVEQH